MTDAIRDCDRRWCHALMLYCHFDFVNDVVRDVGKPQSGNVVYRNGAWCCSAAKILQPDDMRQVLKAVTDDEPARQLLCKEAIEMLFFEAVPA